jgi:hypothetical protein
VMLQKLKQDLPWGVGYYASLQDPKKPNKISMLRLRKKIGISSKVTLLEEPTGGPETM